MKLDRQKQNDTMVGLTILHQLGINIIVSVCMSCGEYLGEKDGEGNFGLSHGLCVPCLGKAKKELKGGEFSA